MNTDKIILFLVIFCTSLFGALSNRSIETTEDSLIIGSIFGLLFGIPMTIVLSK